MKTALLICITFASASFAVAQTPPENTTSPSSASSPHQRQTTSNPTKEAAPTKESATPTNPSPSAASSPHQKQVTAATDKTKEHEKMMTDCVAKQRSMNATMSQDAAKKACTEQMKSKANTETKKY